MTVDERIDAVMAVMERAFDPYWREAWSRRQVLDTLTFSSAHLLVIDETGEIPDHPAKAAGFVFSRTVADEEELLLVAVLPEHRGKGLGRILIERFKQNARERGVNHVFLEMRTNNPAERVYRAAGFDQIGKRPAYYRTSDGTPVDAITFGMNFPK